MRKAPTLEATAVHEAGHAVAAWRLGLHFSEISIGPIEDRYGVGSGRVVCARGDARQHAIYYLSGAIAQDLFCTGYDLGNYDDMERAKCCISIIISETKPNGFSLKDEAEILALLQREAERMMQSNEQHVRALASALLIRKHMKGDEARLILERV